MSNATEQRPTAVVLCSGGLDSTTCMAIAADRGHRIVALSFDYGQRHRSELEAAKRVATHYGAERHYVMQLDLFTAIGGSALTDTALDVPKHDDVSEVSPEIPVTYVPARNLVFLSYAVGVAEMEQAEHIYIGVNAIDYSGYPDCRPEFIEAFQGAARLATKAGVESASPRHGLTLHTPLISLTKAGIIQLGHSLSAPLELTHSCYDPVDTDEGTFACGRCDACLLRLKGFEEAGMRDPVAYREG
ncbi:MAG: 7-cyano-7-deazaguanine synthase QueC [Bradymonadia bacterium]